MVLTASVLLVFALGCRPTPTAPPTPTPTATPTQPPTPTAATPTPTATLTPTPAPTPTPVMPVATPTPSPTPMLTATPTPAVTLDNPLSSGLSIADVVETALASVVQIESNGGTGTGFIVNENGLVVTNKHVVAGSTQVRIRWTQGGVNLPGHVTELHPTLDLAYVSIESTETFTPIVIGDSDRVRVGAEVIAIGFPLGSELGSEPTVSLGIISAKRNGLLQTDASLNPGNSGGPLLDVFGLAVGVVVSRVEQDSSGRPISGIGFAIPINKVKAEVEGQTSPAIYTPVPTPTATSIPPPTPTATPLPTEAELEQRALDQGYDLRRLTDLSALGFTSELARFSLAGTRPLSISTITNASNRAIIRFEREYQPSVYVAPEVPDQPYFSKVAILLDLYESEAEAAAFVQAFEFAPPGCRPFLLQDIAGHVWGFYMGESFFENAEKLEVPIEGVSGFHVPTTTLGGFRYDHDFLHIYFLSHGRMAGYLLVQGDKLVVEDTISLAAKLTGPPTPTDDAQEPERNLQSLCELFEVLGNL